MPNTTLSDEDVSALATCTDTFNKTAMAADGKVQDVGKKIMKKYISKKIVGPTLNTPAMARPPVPAGPR